MVCWISAPDIFAIGIDFVWCHKAIVIDIRPIKVHQQSRQIAVRLLGSKEFHFFAGHNAISIVVGC